MTGKKFCHKNAKRMPRTPNKVKTVTITVSTTPPIFDYLEELVGSGLFGKNAAEAAERLIARGIEQHLAEGTLLQRIPAPPRDGK